MTDINNELTPLVNDKKIILRMSPRGSQGATGEAATIEIGEVSLLPLSETPTVENVGTNTHAILNFGIPVYQPQTAPFRSLRLIDDGAYFVEYAEIDYTKGKEYIEEYVEENLGDSSAFGINGMACNHGYLYDDYGLYLMKIPRQKGRYASFGVAQSTHILQDGVPYSQIQDLDYLPFIITDGMNEFGLCCSISRVPKDYGKTTGTEAINEKEKINLRMLPRFLLDNFCDVNDVIENLSDNYSMFVSENDDNEYAFFLHDSSGESCVLEFHDNAPIFVTTNILTSFHTNGLLYVDELVDLLTLTPNAHGVERYNRIYKELINGNFNKPDKQLVKWLNLTNKYDMEDPWLSDYGMADGTTTVYDIANFPDKFKEKVGQEQNFYLAKEKRKYQFSAHSCIYLPKKDKILLCINEADKFMKLTYNILE